MNQLLEYLESTARFEKLREYEGKSGLEISASCPFAAQLHDNASDRHPSWGINVATGKWHCFTCREGGELPDLIEKLELPGILAANGLMVTPDFNTQVLQFQKKLSREDTSHTSPVDFWPLPNEFKLFEKGIHISLSRMYLLSVGIKRKSITQFGVGYDSKTHDIIYPIPDTEGYQVAWQRRRRGRDPSNLPRFQFPSGFTKGNYLYNLHRFSDNDDVIIVEGIKAVIKLWQWGIRCVSCLSDNFSREHAALLARMRSVTFLFDGDGAGQRGMHGYFNKRGTYVPGALALMRETYLGDTYWSTLPDNGKNSSPDDFPEEVVRNALASRKRMRISKIPSWEKIRGRI